MTENGGRLQGAVVVVNPNGLHMRPASVFARAAQQYSSAVTVRKGENSCNGKSLIDLMMLAAEPGTRLVVEVEGHDSAAALPVLLEILAAPAADGLAD